MNRRAAVTSFFVVLILCSIAMAIVAAERYPAYFTQPGSRMLLLEPIAALVVYLVAILLVARTHGQHWESIRLVALRFGILSGACEVANIGFENGIPFAVHGPLGQIAGMLIVFGIWALAAFRTARALGELRAGIIAAAFSAGVCMVIGVAAGFAMEFFVVPPRVDYVSSWPEFHRSGWTDPRAFGIANTLDSGFTHLAMAPLVAVVLGALAAWAGKRMRSSRG